MPSHSCCYEIRLLGPCTVDVDGVRLDLTQWPGKAGALLRLLAAVQEHRLTRDEAIELLWPEVEPAAGTSNLKGVVFRLRRVLGEEFSAPMVLERGWVTLNPACSFEIDADRLQSLAEQAGEDIELLEEAARLYRGEPLPEDRYEDWATPAREYLRQRWRDVCLRLIRLGEERAERERSQMWAQRLVEADPLDEEAVQAVLRITVATGRRAEARRIFRDFDQRLREQLGTGPSAATRVLVAAPGNLPSPSSSFVGRKADLEGVGELVRRADVRLVTLTGPGGVGKTRLALEVARYHLDLFTDGVYFVSLSPLRDPAPVPSAIAQALQVREAGERSVEEALAKAIGQKEILLILDNFEHVLPAAPLVADLLAACPSLKVLLTSRASLHLAGEHVYPLPPLALPGPHQSRDISSLSESDAVVLFLQRGRSVRPGLVFDGETVSAAAEICRRLEGMPLAIELAAARVGALSLQRIASGLDDAPGLLTAGYRAAESRQQTLRATLDWSYDLLSEAEQKLFCRLSIFAGGWTLEAAEVIGADDGADSAGVLDVLSHLVDHSLVLAEPGPEGTMRYRMLEPIRQYAYRRLVESGQAEAVQRRHASIYLDRAEAADPELAGPNQAAWLERLWTEVDNFRVALRWAATDRGDAELGLRLAIPFARFLARRSSAQEAQFWIVTGLAQAGRVPADVRARALQEAGYLAGLMGEVTAAGSYYEEALASFQSIGDERGIAWTLGRYADVLQRTDDRERLRSMAQKALRLGRKLGDQRLTGGLLEILGNVSSVDGDLARGRLLLEEALAISRQIGNDVNTGTVAYNLAVVERRSGNYARAAELSAEALTLFARLGEQRFMWVSFDGFGALAHELGDDEHAVRLCRVASRFRESYGFAPNVRHREIVGRCLDEARAAMGDEAFTAAWEAGGAMSQEDACAYALTFAEGCLPLEASPSVTR